MKTKTNISVLDNTGARTNASIIVGDYNGYTSGDILDANSTAKLVDDRIEDVIGVAPETFDSLGEIVEELEKKANSEDLAEVATTGNYEDLNNVPSGVSYFNNDADYVTEGDLGDYVKVDGLSDIVISTIHINESESYTGSKVRITGDLGKDAESAETNAIRWIRDNSKLYIGRYSEKLHYLAVIDINNINNYDGYWAQNDLYNQYMKLPKFWYKCVNTENGCDISFTNSSKVKTLDGWNEWSGDTFIATYKAHAVGDTTQVSVDGADLSLTSEIKLVSHPDVKPSTNISWMQFKDITRKMGKGFSMVTYEAHKIMEILFYAWYGEVDALLICGTGASVSDWYGGEGEHENGRVMDSVIDFTDTDADDEPNCNHFWGLCDWWGNVYEWIDNLLTLGYDNYNQIDGSDVPKLALLDYNGNPVRTFNIPYVDDCQTKKLWGEYADVIPVETLGVDNDYYDTGYTVYGIVNTDFGDVALRSYYSDFSSGGVGYLSVGNNPANRDSIYGSRLLYTGAWAEVGELNGLDYAYISDYDISTIKIDESEADGHNKVQISGNNGVVYNIKSASKLYIGKYNTDYNKMLVKEFNSSDTSWTGIDGASLFMCLPEFWYKCINTPYGCDISFTMKKEYTDDTWNHWNGKKLIGCYKVELAGDQSAIDTYRSGYDPVTEGVYFEGKPGVKPSTWFSLKQGREIARNMGDGFSLITYEAHKVMEILFYAYYMNVDAQAVCGAGASVPSWSDNNHLNGRELDAITNLTDTEASNNPTCNHFWGLCDWWGNVYEWIDNLQVLGSSDGSDDHINIAVLDKDGKIVRVIDGAYQNDMTTKKIWGKYADVIAEEYTNGYDDYSDGGYTVFSYVYTDFGSVALRSYRSDLSTGGVGYLYFGNYPDYRYSHCGSRLFYDGEFVVVTELEP